MNTQLPEYEHVGIAYMHYGLANILMAGGNLESAREEYMTALQEYQPVCESSHEPKWVQVALTKILIINQEI